jgi:hypothetical protein
MGQPLPGCQRGRRPTATRSRWAHARIRTLLSCHVPSSATYLGFVFRINGKLHYGWARLTVTDIKPLMAETLTGYAYETVANKSIKAGKTKGPDVITAQPATLGHLAAGASAIPAWRVKPTAATTH